MKNNMLNYDKDKMPSQLVKKLSSRIQSIRFDKLASVNKVIRIAAIWLRALVDYAQFKVYCQENNIEIEMSYAEYPHGMFSAHKYPSYMVSTAHVKSSTMRDT